MRIARPERTSARQRTRAFTFHYAINIRAQDHGDQHYLQHDDYSVEVRYGFQTTQVKGGHKGHQRHHKHPRWDGRHQSFKIDFRQQNVDHRREQIVEQRRPTHHKADSRANGFLGVSVCRASRRIAANQLPVAQSRKQDRNQCERIGCRHMTIREA